jgi:hypothetical protein
MCKSSVFLIPRMVAIGEDKAQPPWAWCYWKMQIKINFCFPTIFHNMGILYL